MVNQHVANPENRIPAEPEFCMDRADVRDPFRADQLERVAMFARLPGHPDIEIKLMGSAGLKPEPRGVDQACLRDPLTAEQGETITTSAQLFTHPDLHFPLLLAAGIGASKEGLIERSNAAQKWQTVVDTKRFKQLRAAPRTIHGITGDELAESISEDTGIATYSFWCEVIGTENNVSVPYAMIKLNTGSGPYQPAPSSISQGAATVLRDKILPTFHLMSKQTRTKACAERGTCVIGQWRETPADKTVLTTLPVAGR